MTAVAFGIKKKKGSINASYDTHTSRIELKSDDFLLKTTKRGLNVTTVGVTSLDSDGCCFMKPKKCGGFEKI